MVLNAGVGQGIDIPMNQLIIDGIAAICPINQFVYLFSRGMGRWLSRENPRG